MFPPLEKTQQNTRIELDFIYRVLVLFLSSLECFSIGSMFDIVDQKYPTASAPESAALLLVAAL